MNDADLRKLFSGIEVPVTLGDNSEVCPINFDNAATTPPLKKVDEFIYQNTIMYGSVGRGGHKSVYCTQAYEVSREEILKFFNVTLEDNYEVIYVKNTTEGINLLANILCRSPGTKILTTRMEHHANDLPWRHMACPYYCEVNEEDGQLNTEEIELRLERAKGTIKYVTITGASNVTGYVTPIHEIAKIVHRYGAKLIVDGAQLVAHRPIDIKGKNKEEAIDFLVFSGHKIYAPFGSGVIIAKREMLLDCPPFLRGGGGVEVVLDDDVYYKEMPYRAEVGTPNFLGVMSIVAAVTVLKEVGFETIVSHEERLKKHMLEGLSSIKRVIMYGDKKAKDRLGIAAFSIEGMHQEKVGSLLQDMRGIAVRTGCFCAHPYVMRMLGISNDAHYQYLKDLSAPHPGMVRASLGLYNTIEEVDTFLEVVETIARKY